MRVADSVHHVCTPPGSQRPLGEPYTPFISLHDGNAANTQKPYETKGQDRKQSPFCAILAPAKFALGFRSSLRAWPLPFFSLLASSILFGPRAHFTTAFRLLIRTVHSRALFHLLSHKISKGELIDSTIPASAPPPKTSLPRAPSPHPLSRLPS